MKKLKKNSLNKTQNEGQTQSNGQVMGDIKQTKQRVSKRTSTNREIVLMTYVFVGLFAFLLVYLTYFLAVDSKEVINSSYNKRQDLLATRIVRGEILGSNGEVLAKTEENDGVSKRIYPYDNLFSNVVGRFSKGRTGIESSQNFKLLTSSTNSIMKIINELAGEKNIGDNVVTTLNVELQKVAYQALGNNKGAIVVMEPSTGKILAMVSKPDYNPNTIEQNWDKLTNDSNQNSALINRASQGLYPPGSTFKLLTALEYMRENKDYENYEYTCEGSGIFNGVKINCYNNKKHGTLSLSESLAKSCNTSFANIGTKIDLKAFQSLAESFLFNSNLPLDFPYNKSSFVLNENSDEKEIAQTVIGQGKTQVTPMHMALITSAIANGGTLMKPYVVDHIETYNGGMVKKYMPSTYANLLSTKEADVLTDYMQQVVKDGTGYGLNNLGFSVAGKTGSAEFDSGKSSHAWFVGFAPADQPELVVSIIVEGAGTGSDHAVPIARKIFQTYFK